MTAPRGAGLLRAGANALMLAPMIDTRSREDGAHRVSSSGGVLLLVLLLHVPPSAPRAGEALTDYGDVGKFAIPGLAAVVSLARKDTHGVLQLGVTWAVAAGTTEALKHATDIDRPNGEPHSFPSGHTTSAMVGASYLHYRYGWRYAAPAYVAAAVVAYSRVDGDFHRWEDVVASTAIANAAAFLFTDTFDENVTVVPIVDPGKKNFGLLANIRF